MNKRLDRKREIRDSWSKYFLDHDLPFYCSDNESNIPIEIETIFLTKTVQEWQDSFVGFGSTCEA